MLEPTTSEVVYGVQLWRLNCIFSDGHNYRWSRTHRAVEPSLRGKIAVTVNRALKRQFRSPAELREAAHLEGNLVTMPVSAATDLRALLPPGSTVSTYVVSDTRTGLQCRVLVFAVFAGEIVLITKSVAPLVNCEMYHEQIIVPATRKDAGGHLVRVLSQALHGDPSALRHQSLAQEG